MCFFMKLRLSGAAVSTNTLAYTWYLAKAADQAFPKKSFQPARLAVYARIGVDGRRATSYKNKATSGHNGVFWRPQLPAKGFFALFGGLALLLTLWLMFAFVAKGLAGLGMWAYAQSLQVSPLLLFGYILVIHLALRGSSGFFKNSQGRRTVVTYLTWRSAQGVWSSLRIFTLSLTAVASLCWAGFRLLKKLYAQEQPHLTPRPDHYGALTPLRGMQQGFVHLVPSQAGRAAKIPKLVFKLSDLNLLAQHDRPAPLCASALFVDSCGARVALAGVLRHPVTSRVHTLSSETCGLSWPSIPAQMLHRTTAVRVLLSAWHVFNHTLEEQDVRFGVSSASRIPSYSGEMRVLPKYAKVLSGEKHGSASPASVGPRILPEINVSEYLARGVAFRVPTPYDSLALAYTRFFLLAPQPTKGKTASFGVSWSPSLGISPNLPQLRSSVRAGMGVGFSSVQTTSHSVKTKPWQRV